MQAISASSLLSPTLFDIFLERIMTDALEYHQGTVSIEGWEQLGTYGLPMTLMELAGKEEELASLLDRLDNTSAASGMEISAEKTKLMTNNVNGISADIRINGEKLDKVDPGRLTASSIWVQLSQIKVPSLKYCPELHRQQQH